MPVFYFYIPSEAIHLEKTLFLSSVFVMYSCGFLFFLSSPVTATDHVTTESLYMEEEMQHICLT